MTPNAALAATNNVWLGVSFPLWQHALHFKTHKNLNKTHLLTNAFRNLEMNKSSCDVLDGCSDLWPEPNTNLHQDMGGLILDAPYHTHTHECKYWPKSSCPYACSAAEPPPPPHELTHSCHVSCLVFVGDSTQHKHTNNTDAAKEKNFLVFKFFCKKVVFLLTV